MFPAPEGEKLFLWMKAKRALEKARLFTTQQDWDILNVAQAAYNQKVDELLEAKFETGWKPSTNKDEKEQEFRDIENAAAVWVEQNVPGYLEAFNKIDSLFGSALDDDAGAHG